MTGGGASQRHERKVPASRCPARLQRKSAAEGHFYSPGVLPPFTPGGVELGRLGGCGAGARRSTLLVGRPKTAPALGRVDFAPGVVLGGHLALALPPAPYAQFPSFGRPAGRTRGRKGTTAAASSAEQGEWTPCEPSSPSQPSKVTSEAHPVAFDHPTPPVQQASTPPFGAPLASTALRTPDFAPGRWWVGVRALVRVVGRRRASTAGELATNHQPHHHHLRPDLRRIDRDDPGH